MVARPRCESMNSAGGPCRAAPLHDGTRCFWHDPDTAIEAAAARRLGGQRRRHEQITAGAYDIEALETPDDVRRVIEIAVIETLGLPNAVPRNRTLLWSSSVFLKFLEVGHLEERLEAVEAALRPRRKPGRTR